MRRYCLWLAVVVLGSVIALRSLGAEYQLTNGDKLRGELASFDDAGFVIRLEVGGFSPRINWTKLTQESLKEIVKDPRAAKFAEPFIDIPIEQQPKKPKKEIKVLPVQNRVEPSPKVGLFAAFASPIGLTIVVLLYLANLFAAYEIAAFRNRPVALVCGLSAVLPIIGPILFLSFPTEHVATEETFADEGAEVPASATGAHPQAKKTGPAPASSLGLQAAEKKGGASMEPTTFKRGDTTFNRRFFETKFSGFFRVVPSEAEKDMVIVVRAAKNEYVAKRISRISASDLHLQLLHGATEASVGFADIVEVRLRHKDAK